MELAAAASRTNGCRAEETCTFDFRVKLFSSGCWAAAV